MSNYIFVDVEAFGQAPINGKMTEFGAVHEKSLKTFHGVIYKSTPEQLASKAEEIINRGDEDERS